MLSAYTLKRALKQSKSKVREVKPDINCQSSMQRQLLVLSSQLKTRVFSSLNITNSSWLSTVALLCTAARMHRGRSTYIDNKQPVSSCVQPAVLLLHDLNLLTALSSNSNSCFSRNTLHVKQPAYGKSFLERNSKKIKPITKYFARLKVNLHEEGKCILCQLWCKIWTEIPRENNKRKHILSAHRNWKKRVVTSHTS